MIKWLLSKLGWDADHSCVSELPHVTDSVIFYNRGQEAEVFKKLEEMRTQANSYTMGPESLKKLELDTPWIVPSSFAKTTDILDEMKAQLENHQSPTHMIYNSMKDVYDRLESLEELEERQNIAFNRETDNNAQMLKLIEEQNARIDDLEKKLGKQELATTNLWMNERSKSESIDDNKIIIQNFHAQIEELQRLHIIQETGFDAVDRILSDHEKKLESLLASQAECKQRIDAIVESTNEGFKSFQEFIDKIETISYKSVMVFPEGRQF